MDPLSLTVIGGLALAEGVKFLYGQAGELLRSRRERKAASRPSTPPPPGLLDGDPGPLVPDAETLDRLAGRLENLRDDLEPYALDRSRVETDRPVVTVNALREALEAVYGRRLTFAGEQRPMTGTVITGAAKATIVEGLLVGVRIDELTDVSHVQGTAEAGHVRRNGETIGVDARRHAQDRRDHE